MILFLWKDVGGSVSLFEPADLYVATKRHTCESAADCRTLKEVEKKCDTVGDDERLEKRHTDPTDTEQLLYFAQQNILKSSIVRDEAGLVVHSAPSQLRLALHGNTVCLVQWKSVAYVTL